MAGTASLLWPYFTKAEGGASATCRSCLRVCATKGGNTTSLRKHMKGLHNKDFQKVLKAEEERKLKKEGTEVENERH